MTKKTILNIIIFSFLATTSLFAQKTVENGIVDIRNINFDKVFLLEGEWEFYWNELLTPDQLKNRKPDTNNFIKVNGDWNNYIYNGKPVKNYGYATYKVKIIAPPGQYTIQLHQVLTAYKIWIDGDLKKEVGKVGTDRKSMTPKLNVVELNFVNSSDTIELVAQVSNFYHGAGGIQEKVFIGKPNVIQQKTTNHLLISFFIIGAELIFSLYFLFIFFYRQKDLAYIFLSLAIFIFITFEIVNGEMILLRYFPNLPWDISKKIDFFSNYNRLTFFSLFIWFSFREYKIVNRTLIHTIAFFAGLTSLVVLFTPSYIFSKTLVPFMTLGLPAFLYLLYITIKGLFQNVPYVVFTFIGMLALNISAINDMLFNLNILNTGYYGSYGLLLLFIGSSITISLKYSHTSDSVDNITLKYNAYEEIQSKLIKIQSFDLKSALEIIDEYFNAEKLELLLKNKIIICECRKTENGIECGNQEKHFKQELDRNLLETIDNKQQTITKKNKVFIPLTSNDKLKAILYIEREEKNFNKWDVDLLELLMPQLSTIIDNYTFYWNLDSLNKNLEEIIEARTQMAYKQKQELLAKSSDLDEKIEELNISSTIVEDLNDELKSQREEINVKNTQLDILRKQILLQKRILEEKQENIHSSINYAKKIQKALLSSTKQFPIEENFIINIPKEIVSGDFYMSIVHKDQWLLALVDSTGRNVSATFLSFLIQSIIEETIQEDPENIYNPADVLSIIRDKFNNSLLINKDSSKIQDSFDISICSINLLNGNIKFAGANQDLLLIRKGEEILLEGNNFSIGGYFTNKEKVFTTKSFDLKLGDLIYLYSDGYYNQISSKNKTKLGRQNFHTLIKETTNIYLDKQKDLLIERYNDWKGNMRQVDDVFIVGVKFTR